MQKDVLPSYSDVGERFNSAMKEQVTSLSHKDIAQFSCEKWWHVSFQSIVYYHCEMTSNDTMFIKGFNTIFPLMVHCDIIYLDMLKVSFIVNVRVICNNNMIRATKAIFFLKNVIFTIWYYLIIIFEPTNMGPRVSNNSASELY